jgi:hypothetical protein
MHVYVSMRVSAHVPAVAAEASTAIGDAVHRNTAGTNVEDWGSRGVRERGGRGEEEETEEEE